MFGNNAYLYQPYSQAANMTRNLSGLASSGVSNIARNGLSSSALVGNGLSGSIGKGLLSKFSFSGFLNGASKTLNVVNQAIPIFYQVKPIINNAKTMFRIMGAVKDTPSQNNTTRKNTTTQNNNSNINNSNIVSNNVEPVNTSDNYSYQEENPVFFI